jgi:hypothetical protein
MYVHAVMRSRFVSQGKAWHLGPLMTGSVKSYLDPPVKKVASELFEIEQFAVK